MTDAWSPEPAARLIKRVRVWLAIFIAGMVLSGLTAFPLETELECLARWLGVPDGAAPAGSSGLVLWIVTVRDGLRDTYSRYPFVAYGTDWLAFAHLIIALLFVGPWRDPLRNAWVVTWGLWACVLVFPLAFVCGAIRGIPLGWQFIDCSFGVFGFVALWMARRCLLALEAEQAGGPTPRPPRSG